MLDAEVGDGDIGSGVKRAVYGMFENLDFIDL